MQQNILRDPRLTLESGNIRGQNRFKGFPYGLHFERGGHDLFRFLFQFS